jgi:hypothetical protein
MNRINTENLLVLEPLYIAGESSLPFISRYLKGNKIPEIQKEKLILLCGRKGGEQAHQLLLNLLSSHQEDYMTIIKSLYRSNYVPKNLEQPVFVSMANKLLTRSAGIIYMQNSLQRKDEKYKLLINSFNLELNSIRESLLYVFALLYDRENINKVRTAYATEKKQSIVNAMEIIDITVRKDLAISFNTIFEPGNIAERMHDLRKIYPVEFFENVERILTRVLAEETRPYNNWTMACSLYTSKKQQHEIDGSLIKKYTLAENILLRETAFFAL